MTARRAVPLAQEEMPLVREIWSLLFAVAVLDINLKRTCEVMRRAGEIAMRERLRCGRDCDAGEIAP
jgi:hypothetical protein